MDDCNGMRHRAEEMVGGFPKGCGLDWRGTGTPGS